MEAEGIQKEKLFKMLKLSSPKPKLNSNRKRKISRTPRLAENNSREDKLTISNDANKTFNEDDRSPLNFNKLQKEMKNDGTRTEYALHNNQSQDKYFEQFALKDYTEKEFQVMGSIVDKTKEGILNKLISIENRLDSLSLVFTLINNVKIAGEKSIVGYFTAHIFDPFMRAIREDLVKREDFLKLQQAYHITNMELDIVKQRSKELGDSIIGVKHDSVALRESINDKVEISSFLSHK